jgi:hypothetical protein
MAEENVTQETETATAEADPAAEVILEGFSLPGKDEGEAEEKESAGEADEATAPEPKAKDDGLEQRLAKIEKDYTSASTHIKDLQKALHATRQENKALKEGKGAGEEVFTDAQFKAILDEHGSDWGVAMNVLKQMVKQEQTKGSKQVLDDVETKQVRTNLDGFLSREWPEVLQEGTEAHTNVEKAKEHFRIQDSPYGTYLASGAVLLSNMPTIVKKIKEDARREALEGKTEAPKGLPVDVTSKAKQMGLNKRQTEIYAKLLKGGKRMAAEMGA